MENSLPASVDHHASGAQRSGRWPHGARHRKPPAPSALSTAGDSQSGLSSGEHVEGGCSWLAVAEHAPEHVDASSAAGQHSLSMSLEWTGNRTGWDAHHDEPRAALRVGARRQGGTRRLNRSRPRTALELPADGAARPVWRSATRSTIAVADDLSPWCRSVNTLYTTERRTL